MRGYPEFNFPSFDRAADRLRARGSYVFNPAEHDRQKGFDPTDLRGTMEELEAVGFDLRESLRVDLSFILDEATHIWMLAGWSRSTGATAERALGLALGLTIEGAAA